MFRNKIIIIIINAPFTETTTIYQTKDSIR